MLEIQVKFGELGHSVFLEFGWNTKNGVTVVNVQNVSDVVKMRNLIDIKQNKIRWFRTI